MAYSDLVNVDYTGRGNTSTGAANSTTGSGGELVDRAGGRVSIASGRLSITHRDLEWLEGSVFPTGSPTYELNQIAEKDIPAGFVNGDGITLRVRENIMPSWGSQRGGYLMHFFVASATGALLQIAAISNASRSEDNGAAGFTWGSAWTYDNTKPYRLQLKIEQLAGVDTLTTTVFDMSSGSPVQVFTRSTTVGAGGSYWTSGTDYGYLATPGRVSVGNSWNKGYNSGVAAATKITRVRIAHEPAIPPLSCGTPTLTSRSTGTNTVDVNSAGGDGGAVTFNMYSSLAADFTPGAGNIIATGDADGTVAHAHGDAPAALPPGGGELRFYHGAALQGATTAFSSTALMVQSLAPNLPAISIRADILASRKLVVGFGGDSLTGSTSDVTGATLTGASAQTVSDLTSVYGIPSGNIVGVQIGAPGSMLSRDWQPDSVVYNASEGASVGGNGYPNGTPRLLVHYVDRLVAAETANPGALVVASFALGTNDLQNYNAGTMTDAAVIGWWQAIINYIRVTRGKTDWKIVINGIPFGSAGTINVPNKIAAYMGWRRAMLAQSWGTNAGLGTMAEWYGVYVDQAKLADGIHYTTAGYQWRGSRQADGLAYSALYDPPTTPPAGTPTLAISYVAGVLRLTRGGTITGVAISYRLERIVDGVATTLTTTMSSTFDDTGYTGASGQSYRVTPYNSVGDGTSATASASGAGDGEPEVTDTTTTTLTTTPQAIATAACKLQVRQGRVIRLAIKGTGDITTAEDAGEDYMELTGAATSEQPESFNVGSGSTLYAWKTTDQSDETVKLTAMV